MTAIDVRNAVRGLRSWRRTPGSALLVLVVIGVSAGAQVALLGLFNALFWRELPVSHPDEIVGISGADRRVPDWEPVGIPVTLFASLDRSQRVFQSFAGFEPLQPTALIGNTSRRLAVEGVTGRYFDTLGIRPGVGRLVDARDVDGASPVATISFRCWHTRFGADPNVIGRTFRLRNESVTVIGVAPAAFTGLDVGSPADAWVPESLVPRLLEEAPDLDVFESLVGRLRPGVTLDEARSQLESLWPPARQAAAAAVGAAMGKGRDADTLALQPRIESAARGFSEYRAYYRRTLVLLLWLSAMTLVLSCANLSGLLLARWSTREADLAVQAALGATNGRLVSQVAGESLTFSMIAIILSAPIALWSAKGLVTLLWNAPDVSSPLNVALDDRLLGVMLLLAGVVALCVSLLPASRIWSGKLTLVRGTRGLPGRGVTRWGRWLVIAQVALSVPLLVMAWIVSANLHRLEGVNTGFRPDEVDVISLTDRTGIAPAADPVAYFTRLTSALRSDPGIAAAALSWNEPGSFGADYRRRPVTSGDGLHGDRPFVMQVSPGFLEALSVPLVAGRDFAWTDDGRQPDVAIVSEGLARALFPDANPVGRRVRLGGPSDRVLDVIGVAADARLAEPHASHQLFLFTALLQEAPRSLQSRRPYVLLKSSLAPHTLEAEARRTIVGLGRDDLVDAHPLQHTLDAALLRERVLRLGAFYFAGFTTLLVFVGLYAVLNLGVMRRIPEIGLRIALGASAHDIRSMVVREALVTASAGLIVGLPCAFFSGRLIASTLTLVGPHDVVAFGAAVALVFAVTVLSVLTPLRRASGITPVEALSSQ